MRHWNLFSRPPSLIHRGKVFTLPMRHWNQFHTTLFLSMRIVFTLPMRHWNMAHNLQATMGIHQFLPYLWGIETRVRVLANDSRVKVFTLPMRHWNRSQAWHCLWFCSVFTLPMRHWNSKYPVGQYTGFFVFTLPMRHWNSNLMASSIYPRRFLPYLWGIETLTMPYVL